uniref:Centromere protein S n=1 Tax=Xiphophorus couchianus TaxID=32473 RepID=A0A3B5M381_9TELE
CDRPIICQLHQVYIFAKDLEAFARHAKRSTVSAEDVKLLARRSRALVGLRKITKLHLSFNQILSNARLPLKPMVTKAG